MQSRLIFHHEMANFVHIDSLISELATLKLAQLTGHSHLSCRTGLSNQWNAAMKGWSQEACAKLIWPKVVYQSIYCDEQKPQTNSCNKVRATGLIGSRMQLMSNVTWYIQPPLG